MVKCIVTGGAGFVGSYVAASLLALGHEVIVIDDLSMGNIKNVPDGAKIVLQSLKEVNPEFFYNIDVVYHLASISGEAFSFFSPSASLTNNIAAATNVILNCIKNGVRRIVFTSSMAVYGNRLSSPFSENDVCSPSDPYGLAKLTIEKLIKIYGLHSKLEWSILRLHNVYGPRINLYDPYRGVIPIFINRMLRNKPPIIYDDGKQLRAFTYVEDIVPYIVDAGFNDMCNHEIINLGSGNPTTVLILADLICELMGKNNKYMFLPPRVAEAKDAFTTTAKSEKILGFEDKTSLRDGLIKTIQWAETQKIKDFDYDLVNLEFDLENKLPITWKDKSL